MEYTFLIVSKANWQGHFTLPNGLCTYTELPVDTYLNQGKLYTCIETFGQSASNQFYTLNDPYPFVKVWLKIMHNIHCRKKGVSDWIHLFKYCNIKLLASQWFPIHYLPTLIMSRPMITKFLCTLSLFWLTAAPPLHFSPFLKTAWKQLNYRDRSFLVFNQSSVNY